MVDVSCVGVYIFRYVCECICMLVSYVDVECELECP